MMPIDSIALLPETQPASRVDAPSALSAFEDLLGEGPASGSEWLTALRRQSMDRFLERGYPTSSDEDWRFTPIGRVSERPFRLVPASEGYDIEPSRLAEVMEIEGWQGQTMVFVDGRFVQDLSTFKPTPGVRLHPLAEELLQDGPVRHRFNSLAGLEDDPFVALNTALFRDGACLVIEPGTKAPPVHLVFINTPRSAGAVTLLRNLVIAGPDSQALLVETHWSWDNPKATSSSVVEAWLGDRAELEHIKIQRQGAESAHLSTVLTETGRHSQHRFHSVALGADLSRTTIRARLNGQHGASHLGGIYLAREGQCVDHHMVVEHQSPACHSDERFHGILSGTGRAVFHGRIRVHPGAQKTDAKQTNRNLLLSDKALVNTKPQLEIYADDVKCTHGATIGQIGDEAVFYLRSRGISEAHARRILVHAFAGEILDYIQSGELRDHIHRLIDHQLDSLPELSSSSV